MERALGDTTREHYSRLWQDFVDYCTEEGVESLPAERATIVCYCGHLAELGTWAAGSLQPIFSAINGAHRDVGIEPPAVGNHFLHRVRQGLARAQAETSTRDSRIPLPAQAVMDIVDDGTRAADAVAIAGDLVPSTLIEPLREDTAIAVCSLFAGRQDSAVHLRSGDVDVDDDFIWLRLTEKGKRGSNVRRVVRIPLAQQAIAGHPSAVPQVAALVRSYARARCLLCDQLSCPTPDFFFQLPYERSRPLTRHMEGWLEAALLRVGVSAPPGFAYQGHSIRSMGASCMAAIGIDRVIYIWIGGWARGSSVVDKHYVDPTVLPTPAAYALYGWALSRQFAAGAPVVVPAAVLPDPLGDDVDGDAR